MRKWIASLMAVALLALGSASRVLAHEGHDPIKAKTPMKVEQIQPGTRVVITGTDAKDQSMTATSIEVGAIVPT